MNLVIWIKIIRSRVFRTLAQIWIIQLNNSSSIILKKDKKTTTAAILSEVKTYLRWICVDVKMNNLCRNLYKRERERWREELVAMYAVLTTRQTFWLQRVQNRTDSRYRHALAPANPQPDYKTALTQPYKFLFDNTQCNSLRPHTVRNLHPHYTSSID